MVDELSRLIEIDQIHEKSSHNIAQLVDTQWFRRYPRPRYVIHDNGSEFIGQEFGELLDSCGVRRQTTVKNPQGNVILERVHLVLAEMCRVQKTLVFEANEPLLVHEGTRRVL